MYGEGVQDRAQADGVDPTVIMTVIPPSCVRSAHICGVDGASEGRRKDGHIAYIGFNLIYWILYRMVGDSFGKGEDSAHASS